MSTFTSERSYLAILRAWLRPRRGAGKETAHAGVDTVQPATFPGQNSTEVYGASLLLFAFHVAWCAEALGSAWAALPAAILLIHLSAVASALLGSRLGQRYSPGTTQAYLWPQRVHWAYLAALAWIAIAVPFPFTRWLAWPVLLFLGANLYFWFALREWRALGMAVLWHGASLLAGTLFSWPFALLQLFAGHAVLLFTTLYPHSRVFGPRVRRFRTAAPEVWLTIDDGPSGDTQAILDLLDQYEAKATFFLVGQRAAALPDAVREIAARGHGIANHSFTHPAGWFWIYSWRALRRETNRTQAVLAEITGSPPTLFRSPVGFANPLLRPVLEEAGLTLIGWSARGYDGVAHQADRALDRLKRQIRPGAIILVHEGRPCSVALIAGLLEWLQAEGIRCVRPNLFENEGDRLS